MKIHLATDHAGFEHKEAVKTYLIEKGVEVIDHGAVSVDPLDDYPDFIAPAAQAVALSSGEDAGIIFGGSGQGEAMVANRLSGIRAVVYYGGPIDIVTLSRVHNNTNVLSIGARFVSIEETLKVIEVWSEMPFSNDERDIRRIAKF